MGLNLFNLPDKDYYSCKEIADRWGCDETTITHYIYDLRILRVAIKGRSVNPSLPHLLPCKYTIPEAWEAVIGTLVRNDKGYLEASTNSLDPRVTISTGQEVNFLTQYLYKDTPIRLEFTPKYLYLTPMFVFSEKSLEMGESEDGITVFIETFEGVQAYIIDSYSYAKYSADGNHEYKDICFNAIYQREFTIITKEERDRFENKYGITSDTESVQKEVGKKTENLQLGLMQLFAGLLLKTGLSNNPHTDAEKLIKKIAAAEKTLPCSKETLAKYLKENRL
jgi:hypothetical protein